MVKSLNPGINHDLLLFFYYIAGSLFIIVYIVFNNARRWDTKIVFWNVLVKVKCGRP